MPELPEVEFAARNLRRWLQGREVARAEAEPGRIFRGSDPRAFEEALTGARCEWVERRGKILLLAFSKGSGFLSHLGMTGKWQRLPAGEGAVRHSRARLHVEGDGVVHNTDPRLFGRIFVAPSEELLRLPELRALGPDPWRDGIDVERLHQRLQRTGRSLKVALMDQAVLAGIGNIQATEALFRARLHPEIPARALGRAEVEALAEAIHATLAYTFEQMGEGEAIAYLEEGAHVENPFLAYGKEGQPCPRCGTPLEKIVVAGRGSVYCPRCQKPPAS